MPHISEITIRWPARETRPLGAHAKTTAPGTGFPRGTLFNALPQFGAAFVCSRRAHTGKGCPADQARPTSRKPARTERLRAYRIPRARSSIATLPEPRSQERGRTLQVRENNLVFFERHVTRRFTAGLESCFAKSPRTKMVPKDVLVPVPNALRFVKILSPKPRSIKSARSARDEGNPAATQQWHQKRSARDSIARTAASSEPWVGIFTSRPATMALVSFSSDCLFVRVSSRASSSSLRFRSAIGSRRTVAGHYGRRPGRAANTGQRSGRETISISLFHFFFSLAGLPARRPILRQEPARSRSPPKAQVTGRSEDRG